MVSLLNFLLVRRIKKFCYTIYHGEKKEKQIETIKNFTYLLEKKCHTLFYGVMKRCVTCVFKSDQWEKREKQIKPGPNLKTIFSNFLFLSFSSISFSKNCEHF
jgi:hypothetical protein